ncbi:hypothetical protein Tco_0371189 [Tanacetum coccineum]
MKSRDFNKYLIVTIYEAWRSIKIRLNSAAGWQLLDKMPRVSKESLKSKSKVRNVTQQTDVAKRRAKSCVTCGRCSFPTKLGPAILANVYRDNIKELCLSRSRSYFKQETPVIEADFKSFRPPGFLSGSKPSCSKSRKYSESLHQNRGTQSKLQLINPWFIKALVYRPQVVHLLAYQAHSLQPPAPQIKVVSNEDFHSYVKANEACDDEHANSMVLPLEVVLLTRDPDSITSFSSKVIGRDTSASRPNQKASIPFPSRRNDERRREKANDILKFYESSGFEFEISFTDALSAHANSPRLLTLIGKEKLIVDFEPDPEYLPDSREGVSWKQVPCIIDVLYEVKIIFVVGKRPYYIQSLTKLRGILGFSDCDREVAIPLLTTITISLLLLQPLTPIRSSSIPADYVSAGHVLVSADRDRIC